jgi:hypothetical protein
MSATTTTNITDIGTVINISNTEAILYESSTTPDTIYGLAQSDYQNVNASAKMACLSQAQGTSIISNLLNFNFQGVVSVIFSSSYTISSAGSFAFIIILLTIFILVITIKKVLRPV